jgi:hypothetical protein
VQLLQLVHLLADFIPDWDLVVMALDQLSSVAAAAHDHVAISLPSQPRQISSTKMDWMQPVAGIEGASMSLLMKVHDITWQYVIRNCQAVNSRSSYCTFTSTEM